MISINNVVDVDFKIIQTSPIIGSYKTVAYVIPDKITIEENSQEKDVRKLLCKSYADIEAVKTPLSDEIKYNAKQYFENGGVNLLLLNPEDYTVAKLLSLIEEARNITNDFIYVVLNNSICNKVAASDGYTAVALLDIAKSFEALTPPSTLRLLLTMNIKSDSTYDYTKIDAYKDYNVGVKFCSKEVPNVSGKIIDAALLIGAYFTQVNLNTAESIKDYCYTPEKLLQESKITDDVTGLETIVVKNIASEDVTQSVYSKLVANNFNFIDTIGGKVINFGGNLANGISINIDFATICVENDICSANLNNMLNKQYLSAAGLNNLVSAINEQLQRYKTNGYIKVNSEYSGNDLSIEYNGKSYEVVKKGAVLPQGFKIFAVPISDISVIDKNEKRFTPIYVVIESLAGARTVTIRGEVRQ